MRLSICAIVVVASALGACGDDGEARRLAIDEAEANTRTLLWAARTCESELAALRANAAAADGRAFNFTNMASVEDERATAALSDASRTEAEAYARRARASAAEATEDAASLRLQVADRERECEAASAAHAAAVAGDDRLVTAP